MRLLFYSVFLFFYSCSPNSSSSSLPDFDEQQGAQSGNSSTSSQEGGMTSSSSSTGSGLTSSIGEEEEDEPYIPSYGKTDVGICFNQDCTSTAEPYNPNHIFYVAYVDIYQPLYIDYKQESFPGWNGSLTYFSDGDNITEELKASPEGVSATFTVWQPEKTMAEDAESILNNSYYSLLGHFAKNIDVSSAGGIDELWVAEGEYTALISVPPELTEYDENAAWLAITPPKEYNMVYYVEGSTYEDLALKCQDQVFSAHTPGIFLCDKLYSTKYTGGVTDRDMGSVSSDYLSNLMKNLVIWQPVPEPGYQCLGYIATNDVSQPMSSMYGGGGMSSTFEEGDYLRYIRTFQDSFESLSYGWQDYPMICINQKYLVRGKYGDIVAWTEKTMADGSKKRFLIIKVSPLGPGDPGYSEIDVGLSYTNLFVTLEDIEGGLTIEEQVDLCNGQTISEDCPLWVLNNRYVKVKTP